MKKEPLEAAPPMPAGSVDFAKFHAACAAGDAEAAVKAAIDIAPPPPTAETKAAPAKTVTGDAD